MRFLPRCCINILVVSLFSAISVNAGVVGFIDTPDVCMFLESVDAAAVHLRKQGDCEGKPGRVFVTINPGETRRVYVDGELLGTRTVGVFNVSDATALVDRAESMKLDIPENSHAVKMEAVAGQVNEYVNSTEFQDKLAKERSSLMKGFGLEEQYASYYKDTGAGGNLSPLSADERIYVFISESMPVGVIRTYVADLSRISKLKVEMVLRGFVGGVGKIAPTAAFVAGALKKSLSCDLMSGKECEMYPVEIIVDPLLYRRYGVTQVPAFVFARGVKIINSGMSEGDEENAAMGDFFLMSGDASIKYVLGRIAADASAPHLAVAAEAL